MSNLRVNAIYAAREVKMNDAYEIRKAAEVLEDTWGHLKPKPGRSYNGWILYGQGEYGDIVCIASDFIGLTASPWLYADLQAFLGDNGEEDEKIYLWQGSYCRGREKKFMGQFQKVSSDVLRSVFHQLKGE